MVEPRIRFATLDTAVNRIKPLAAVKETPDGEQDKENFFDRAQHVALIDLRLSFSYRCDGKVSKYRENRPAMRHRLTMIEFAETGFS